MRETEAQQDEEMENLRSKATELLLREEYKPSIQTYSQIISLCQTRIAAKNPDGPHLKKLLCLSFSNRAEARARLSDHNEALADCEEALRIDDSHFKTLVCKGKILLSLNRYSAALCCFNAANLGPQATENSDLVNGFLEKCKRLEFLSRTGAFDISEWVLSGFRGKSPELAEYIGALDIKKSEISGRGLFATKNVESGTLLFVTKAVAVDRARCSTVQKAAVVLDGREGGGDAEVFPGWEVGGGVKRRRRSEKIFNFCPLLQFWKF